jgi:hypothetical protein
MYDGIDSNDFFNKKNFLEKVEFSPISKKIKKSIYKKKKKKIKKVSIEFQNFDNYFR